MPLPPRSETKVCEKCFKKHNFNQKYAANAASALTTGTQEQNTQSKNNAMIELNCNICKKMFSTLRKLQEHLVEHSFQGCDERGYTCYICSAVFTSTNGLLQHMTEHGPNARPYDCNLCSERFFFRAELENHLIDHENGRVHMAPITLRSPSVLHTTTSMQCDRVSPKVTVKSEDSRDGDEDDDNNNNSDVRSNIKVEASAVQENGNEEDDEYIEIEKIAEHTMSEVSNHNDDSNSGLKNGSSECRAFDNGDSIDASDADEQNNTIEHSNSP